MTAPAGRVHEGGYQRYRGERLGPSAAVRSVVLQTLQRVLGLRRPARSKALPFLTVIIAYLPAATFVGIVALLPRQARAFVPDYANYYGFISAAILLFVVFVAPEALCPDRRWRLLSLYLASPLTRTTYLAAKAMAVASVLLLVTLGPPLLLLVGLVLQGVGPDGVDGFATTFARIAGAGLALSAHYTGISLGVSSLTERRAFAAGGTLLLVVGSGIVAGVLFGVSGSSEVVLLANAAFAPIELVTRIYGAPGELLSVPTATVAAAVAAWALGGFGLAWVRYRRLQVTR